MISDITNVLNFEIKNLNIRILEIDEEKKKLEYIQKETLAEAQQLESVYREKIQQVEENLNKKQENVCILE